MKSAAQVEQALRRLDARMQQSVPNAQMWNTYRDWYVLLHWLLERYPEGPAAIPARMMFDALDDLIGETNHKPRAN